MKQYQHIKQDRPAKTVPVAQPQHSNDIAVLTQRLHYTESLVEQQRRQLRLLATQVEQLKEAIRLQRRA